MKNNFVMRKISGEEFFFSAHYFVLRKIVLKRNSGEKKSSKENICDKTSYL